MYSPKTQRFLYPSITHIQYVFSLLAAIIKWENIKPPTGFLTSAHCQYEY